MPESHPLYRLLITSLALASCSGRALTVGSNRNPEASNSGGNSSAQPDAGLRTLPTCDSTQKKGLPCDDDSGLPSCAAPCGPDGVGLRIAICVGGIYLTSDCQFPRDGNYACYRLAGPLPACEAQQSTACSSPACQPCGPMFIDKTGVNYNGYCVCSNGRTECAITTSWPCEPDAGSPNPGCE